MATDKTFAEWLRQELEERDWGVRTLARLMDPENPEVPRRALNHYMRGSRPTERNALLIAQALGVDRDDLPIAEEAARSGGPFRGASGGRADGGVARNGEPRRGKGAGSTGRRLAA